MTVEEARDLLLDHIQKLTEAGWDGVALPEDEAGNTTRCLYYERAFLMWAANMESQEGTYVALLDQAEREQDALNELPGTLFMGVNAVVNAHYGISNEEILAKLLKDLPERIERSKALLVGPAAYYRQIGMWKRFAEQEN